MAQNNSQNFNFKLDNIPVKLGNGEIVTRSLNLSHTVHGDPAHDKVFKAVQELQKLTISDTGNRIYMEAAAERAAKIFAHVIYPEVSKAASSNIISGMFTNPHELIVKTYERLGKEVVKAKSGRVQVIADLTIPIDPRLSSGQIHMGDIHMAHDLKFYFHLDKKKGIIYVNPIVSSKYTADFDGDEMIVMDARTREKITSIKATAITGVEKEMMEEKIHSLMKFPLLGTFNETVAVSNHDRFNLIREVRGVKSISSGMKYGMNRVEREKEIRKQFGSHMPLSTEEFESTLMDTIVPDHIGLFENKVFATAFSNMVEDYDKFLKSPEAKSLIHVGHTEEEIRSLFYKTYGRGSINTPLGAYSLLRTEAMDVLEGPLVASGGLRNIMEHSIIKNVTRAKGNQTGINIDSFTKAVDPSSELKLGYSPGNSLNITERLIEQMVNNGQSPETLMRSPLLGDFIEGGNRIIGERAEKARTLKGDALGISKRLEDAGLLRYEAYEVSEGLGSPVQIVHAPSVRTKDKEGNIVWKLLNEQRPEDYADQQRKKGTLMGSLVVEENGNMKLLSGPEFIQRQLDMEFSHNLKDYAIHDRVIKSHDGSNGFRLPGEASGEMTKEFLLSDQIGAQEARSRLARANTMTEERLISMLKSDTSGTQFKAMVMIHDLEFNGAKTKNLRRFISDLGLIGGTIADFKSNGEANFISQASANIRASVLTLAPTKNGMILKDKTDIAGFATQVREWLQEKGFDLKGQAWQRVKDKHDKDITHVGRMGVGRVGEGMAHDPHSIVSEKRQLSITTQQHTATPIKDVVTVYGDIPPEILARMHGVPEDQIEEFIRNNVTSEGGLGNLSAGMGIMSETLGHKYYGPQRYAPHFGTPKRGNKLVDAMTKMQYEEIEKLEMFLVDHQGHRTQVDILEGLGEAVHARSGGPEILRQQAALHDELNGGNHATNAFKKLQENYTEAEEEEFQKQVSGKMRVEIYHKGELIHSFDGGVATKSTRYMAERPLGEIGMHDGLHDTTFSNMKNESTFVGDFHADLVRKGHDPLEASIAIDAAQRDLVNNNPTTQTAVNNLKQITNFFNPVTAGHELAALTSGIMENNKAVRLGALTALEALSKVRF